MGKKRMTMTLSEHLGMSPRKVETLGILNTNLGIDTKLFIDPKLIRNSAIPEMKKTGKQIHDYFTLLMKVNEQVAKSPRLLKQALSMIAIKEPIGLCIGYGNSRDSGTSIPWNVARFSLKSLNEMLSVGFEDLTVMELLGLFISRFGPDSISDLIAHITYPSLCEFTQRICKENKLVTQEFTIQKIKYQLPVHPFKKTQVIFVPLDILNELPIATSWEEIAAAAKFNADVRQSFNDLVGESVEAYASRVRKSPEIIFQSVEKMQKLVDIYDAVSSKPYDIDIDPLGYNRLFSYFDEISGTMQAPKREFATAAEVKSFVLDQVIPQFRRHVEEIGANKLLYRRIGNKSQKVDITKPVHEEASQVLFHGIADQLCQQSNLMLSRESKTAPGAVDFSVGGSYDSKAIVEIKKSDNNNLLNGYQKQVERYEKAEAAATAVYLVVVVRSKDYENDESQLNQLIELNKQLKKDNKKCPELCIVDGLIHDSASK